MKKIGITGGIGAGKSIVCHIFEILHIPNYPADQRAKWLQVHDPTIKQQIITLLGEQSYTTDGSLDRGYIAKIVFNDELKLKALNQIVHPAVAQDFENWCKQYQDKPFILKEAALLFETGSYRTLDANILVHAPQALRIERVLMRDPYRTEEDVRKIILQQMDEKKKLELADYIIDNDNSKSLIKQCVQIHKELNRPNNS